MLDFFHRTAKDSRRIVLFPGAWNPPTRAHLDIARSALQHSDEVIWILPRTFPHKAFEDASFESRRAMLKRIVQEDNRFSAAVSEGGLYAEIARETRDFLGPEPDIALVLGRDAAERIAAWDYGVPGYFDDFIREYKLLVAARSGEYVPSPLHADRISTLTMSASWDDVSSTELRRRIDAGEKWHELAPPSLTLMIEHFYRR